MKKDLMFVMAFVVFSIISVPILLVSCGGINLNPAEGTVNDIFLNETSDAIGYYVGYAVSKSDDPEVKSKVEEYYSLMKAGQFDVAAANAAIEFLKTKPVYDYGIYKVVRLSKYFGVIYGDNGEITDISAVNPKYLESAEIGYKMGYLAGEREK